MPGISQICEGGGNSMAKAVAQMQAALAKDYAGPTFEKDGRTYIPWNEAVKAANEVFGIDGYDITVKQVRREGDGYVAIVSVTAYPTDGRPIVREGVGYNDELQTKAGKPLTDMSIKGAASDALNRALKLFGSAFGLNLYDKEPAAQERSNGGAASRGQSSGARSSNGSSKRSGPTEKQVEWLVKKGVVESEEEALEMTFEQAKAALDEVFNGGGNGKGNSAKAKAASTARRTGTPDDEDEELPF
jgi:hypothetical protein